ncbi:MAG: MarR family transcriptional regulator [Acidimicrobiia bacterium]|jgi:DNA-binding MarR family transcriptional regulator
MTPTPTTHLADDLLMVVTRLARRLRRVADDGITPTQRSILTTLERRGPLTHGELAAAERVRPPTITAAVDRLETDGLVVRERDADDRRIARVSITEAAHALLNASRRERTAYLEQRLRALPAADRAAIAAAAPALARLLEDPNR